MDWNIANSSLFTGAGLPWGPMQTGAPEDMPAAPKERSLDEFQAFDQSEMVKRLIADLRASGAKQKMGAMRTASRMGAAQSDAARLGLGEIDARVEDDAAKARLDAAKESWADKQAQKARAEAGDIQRYQLAQQNWAARKADYEAEKARRNSQYGNIGNLAALSALL